MSRLVRALEREGLAERQAHERDGRSVVIRATDEGRRTLEQGRARRVSEHAALLEALPSGELETVAAAASIVERALSRHPSA